MAEVSVIVTVLNGISVLERCVAGFDNQTFLDFEVIFVDDGSTDGTTDFLRLLALRNSRYRVIVNTSNMGIAFSRNAGLDAATGRYLMFCDADDWYDGCMIEKLYREITVSKADFVQCGVIRDNRCDEKEDMYLNPRFIFGEFFRRRHRGVNVLVPVKIFDVKFLKKFGIRFPSVRTNEDDVFMAQCVLSCKKTRIIPDRLYHYWYTEGSLTHMRKGDEYEIWEKNIEYLEQFWKTRCLKMSSRLFKKYISKWTRIAQTFK